jgi:hypothetical protein
MAPARPSRQRQADLAAIKTDDAALGSRAEHKDDQANRLDPDITIGTRPRWHVSPAAYAVPPLQGVTAVL